MFWHITVLTTLAFASCACAAPAKPITNVEFTAIDIETTSLSPRTGRIIEIGAIRFNTDGELASTNWLVNPGMPVPASSTAVHGITDADLRDAPPFEQVHPQLMEFVGDSLLIAHNAAFDISFISTESKRHGQPPPTNGVVDTLRMARTLLPDSESYSLGALADALSVCTDAKHRGEADAATCMRIFLELLGRLPDGVSTNDALNNAMLIPAPR